MVLTSSGYVSWKGMMYFLAWLIASSILAGDAVRIISMYCWHRSMNSRLDSIFRNSFLFSLHQCKASWTLPASRDLRMRLMTTKVSTSTRSRIPRSSAKAMAEAS
jgi:hypothetical protein